MKRPPLMMNLLVGAMILAASGATAATFDVGSHPNIGAYTGYETCQGCHDDEFDQHATNIMASIHWTWEKVDSLSGDDVGKINVINNYCVAVKSNEPRCTSCHIGIGWSQSTDIRGNMGKIDCLVCHDGTGTYQKNPTGAGAPFATLGGDPDAAALDYRAIMRSFQSPDRDNCGACHFNGGGGEGVKHGTMDGSLSMPTEDVDVHMGRMGYTCLDCHQGSANSHDIVGTRYSQANNDAALCQNCHTTAEADHGFLSLHFDVLACQTCHVPSLASGGRATKTYWDWETAGNYIPGDGTKIDRVIKNGDGDIVYHSKKGSFVWGYDIIPEYEWANGDVTHITLNDVINPNERGHINVLQGSGDDARVFPVKKFVARQPYDMGTNKLVVPHLFPTPEEKAKTETPMAYWMVYDWEKAVTYGQNAVGLSYSGGGVGFVETDFTWIANHMVKPASQVVQCWECHKSKDRIDMAELNLSGSQSDDFRVSYAGYRIMYESTNANTGPDLNGLALIDTGAYMGYLEVSNAPWVYSYNMGKYLYIPEEASGLFGSWTYMAK